MRTLPCDHEAGRFLLRVRLPTGRTVRMLADTGGGYVISEAAAAGLERVHSDPPEEVTGVRLPLDPPLVGWDIAVLSADRTGSDGVLPAQWFTDRVWTFDHVAGELRLHEPGDPRPDGAGLPLGYPCAGGRRVGPYPRITATIDHEPVELLLDTGATATLTDNGLAVLGEPTVRSSSFITASTLDRWRRAHPDWPVVEAPTTLAEIMIRVPSVALGPAESTEHPVVDLGPVWFESRPDRSFHHGMSQWMDRTVDGALGGNAFAGRRLTLDVPAATAWVH